MRPTTGVSFPVHREVLPSGVRLLVIPTAGTAAVTFFLVVRTGSRHEPPALYGMSHFLEHLFFKGSKKRPSARAIAEAVDRVGGEMNAFTSKEWTALYAKAARRHVDLIVDVISDMVLRPLFDPEDIDRERGVVVEEINMYEDTPLKSVGEFFEETLFGRHALAHPIIGTKAHITRFPRTAMVQYFRRQYRARSVVACVAGDIDPADGVRILRRALGRFPPGTGTPPASFYSSFGSARVRIKDRQTDQTHVMLGAPAVPFLHRDRPAVDLAASILGGGMSSRLFLEVRERRGLAYAVRTSPEHYVDAGYLATQAGLDTAKVLTACRVILREHRRLRERGVGRRELDKAREFVKGKILLALEGSEEAAQFAALQEVLLNRILTPDDYFRLLDEVDPADIKRVARQYLSAPHLRLVAIGPKLPADRLRAVLRGA